MLCSLFQVVRNSLKIEHSTSRPKAFKVKSLSIKFC